MKKLYQRTLNGLLTSPSKIARKLDWKKHSGATVLSLSVVVENHNSNTSSNTAIDAAISYHPQLSIPTTRFHPIPLSKQGKNDGIAQNQRRTLTIDSHLVECIDDIIQNNRVCGVIVSWPVQDQGWCGASCGRVLHVLDQLVGMNRKNVASSSTGSIQSLMSSTCPRATGTSCSVASFGKQQICLYDVHKKRPFVDEWGRNPIFSRLPPKSKTIHNASVEQYGCPNVTAASVWKDFAAQQWPHMVHVDHEDDEKESCYYDYYDSSNSINSSSRSIDRSPSVVEINFVKRVLTNFNYA